MQRQRPSERALERSDATVRSADIIIEETAERGGNDPSVGTRSYMGKTVPEVTTEILTTQFNDLVKNAVVTWREGFGDVPERARQLYEIHNNPVQTTEHSQIDPAGFAKRKDQGGVYAVGSPQQGYTLNLTKSRIGLSESVTWEINCLSPALATA